MVRWLSLCLIGVGFTLVALSLGWVALFPPTSIWTDADAERLDELNDEVYRLYHEISAAKARLGPDQTYEPPPAYQQAIDVRNAHRAKRDIAMTRPKQIAAALKWAGLGTVAVGILAFYVSKHR